MRFKPGQKVVCVKNTEWHCDVTKEVATWPHPKWNEIVTVDYYDGSKHIALVEYGIDVD